ncbi:neuronal PAS domain-containing protein 4-like [Hemitrygon akajei]|uniref:neuronal PAS domain-containing protein 4-like n=1 Tax=Hemitrygon akajei TaxID=2704970 RepID=UPI003BF97E75
MVKKASVQNVEYILQLYKILDLRMTVVPGAGTPGRGQVLGLGGNSPPFSGQMAAAHKHQDGQARRYRSTKGASKARRDLMRVELRTLRNLLPLSQDEKERLSYLNTMAMVNVCVRRAQHRLAVGSPTLQPLPLNVDFLPALNGFLITLTSCGKLVHLSQNVTDYLGLSMVELVTRGDSIDHLVHAADRWLVHQALQQAAPSSGCSFICRMPCSRSLGLPEAHRWVHFSGRYLLSQNTTSTGPNGKLFVSVCSPVDWQPRDHPQDGCQRTFYSHHYPDMSFLSICESVVYHLGYQPLELTGRSWYSLIHPGDLQLSSRQHKQLLSTVGQRSVDFVYRLQHRDSGWAWLFTRAEMFSTTSSIECSHLVISECEALHLRQALFPSDPSLLLTDAPQVAGLQEVLRARDQSLHCPSPPS